MNYSTHKALHAEGVRIDFFPNFLAMGQSFCSAGSRKCRSDAGFFCPRQRAGGPSHWKAVFYAGIGYVALCAYSNTESVRIWALGLSLVRTWSWRLSQQGLDFWGQQTIKHSGQDSLSAKMRIHCAYPIADMSSLMPIEAAHYLAAQQSFTVCSLRQ